MPTPKFQCRHIFPDGHRCGSPTLRKEPFCYYHHTTRKPKVRATCTDTHSHFDLPDLDDRSSIQSAITLVLQRLANGNLDPKRAGLLLYGLQIASSNLPHRTDPAVKPVEDLIEDETHGPIAPVSHIDTSVVDAFTDILAKRMGLNIQAVAEPKTYNSSSLIDRESKHSDSKSGPNSPESNTLRKKYPTHPRPEIRVQPCKSVVAPPSTPPADPCSLAPVPCPYITAGASIPRYSSARTIARRAAAAVASSSAFRVSSVSFKM